MNKQRYSYLYIFLLLLLFTTLPLTGCTHSGDKATVDRVLTNVKGHFAPDGRVALFEVKARSRNGSVDLTGETNLPGAKAALLDSLSRLNIPVNDNIRLLPAREELEGKTFGVVRNSVANIRSNPSHSSELATQATLGMPLKVLKKKSGWYLVQTPDDYLSWIDEGGLHLVNEKEFDEWKASSKLIYLDTYGFAYEQPSVAAPVVSDLVSGSILKLDGSEGNFYKVVYPDGRTAFVNRSEAELFDHWKATLEATEENLVATAKTMMGVPYLWGGTSTKGVDCSGFTKIIYFMNGWVIPRDASQQVKAGHPIDTSEGFDNLRPGDLLFFGSPATDTSPQRVVHVGLWIGNNEFIHAPGSEGRVYISSFDPEAENFDEFNLNRYLETKRYLNNQQGNIMEVADVYELQK